MPTIPPDATHPTMKSSSIPVSIHTTPHPATEADIVQHSRIRLDALRTDPDSFASTYARESKYDRAKWKERLEQEGVWTFYAKYDQVDELDEKLWSEHRHRHSLHESVATTKMSRTLLAGQMAHTHTLGLSSYVVPAEGRPNRGDALKQWLATLTLLSPTFLTSFLASSRTVPFTSNAIPSWPLSLLSPEIDLWLIVGLWVRPEWRRKGVGQKIIQKAVHFVLASLNHHPDGAAATFETSASDAYQSPLGSIPSSKTTLVLLEVYSDNTAAVELYRSAGFEILSNPDQAASHELVKCHKNGNNVGGEFVMEGHKTHWMGYTVPPGLPHRSNL